MKTMDIAVFFHAYCVVWHIKSRKNPRVGENLKSFLVVRPVIFGEKQKLRAFEGYKL
jgi:hypothetical protein